MATQKFIRIQIQRPFSALVCMIKISTYALPGKYLTLGHCSNLYPGPYDHQAKGPDIRFDFNRSTRSVQSDRSVQSVHSSTIFALLTIHKIRSYNPCNTQNPHNTCNAQNPCNPYNPQSPCNPHSRSGAQPPAGFRHPS
jgi:hypothetical protein